MRSSPSQKTFRNQGIARAQYSRLGPYSVRPFARTLWWLCALAACEAPSDDSMGGGSADGGVVDVGSGQDATPDAGPDTCRSYAGPVADVITTRCVGCHSRAAAQGGLDLSRGAASMVDVAALQAPGQVLVSPGDPDASYLLAKLEATPPVGAQMPIGSALSAGEIGQIRAWIEAGARATCAEVTSVVLVAPDQLTVGQTGRAVPLAYDAGAQVVEASFTYEVADGAVLAVAADGTLTGLAEGRTTVVARVGAVVSNPVEISVLPGEDPPPPADCTPYQGAVALLLTTRCAGCHGGGAPQGGFDLSGGVASLVGVPARQAPGQVLVIAGDPDGSYLLAKLGAAPPVGASMPIGGALSAAEITRIRAWITDGALDVCDGEPPVEPVVDAVALDGPARLGVGVVGQADAEAFDAEGAPAGVVVAYEVADPQVLYVDAEGGLLGISAGRTTLTARAAGVASAPIEVEVVAGNPGGATFQRDVLPLLEARCATAGCHVDGVEPGDLRFDRDTDRVWEELLDSAEQVAGRRVVPGQPEASYLIEKLADSTPGFGARMPIGQPPLSAADAARVVRWIVAGAEY